MRTFYPPAQDYYVSALQQQRPIFQGDVFTGGFGAFWAHPEAVRAHRGVEPVPEAPAFPATRNLLDDVRLEGPYAVLLPHPCDYSEGEKGAAHPHRLVAPVLPATSTRVPVKVLRRGEVGHLVWLPKWEGLRGDDDWVANLRWITSIDTAFLPRANRVASLSVQAWVALNDKVSEFFTGARLDRILFAVDRAQLHPDAP